MSWLTPELKKNWRRWRPVRLKTKAANSRRWLELEPLETRTLLASSLAGAVYVDMNNDGLRQAGEAGISGVTLTLSGRNNLGARVNLTTTTDSDGAYAFVNLRPSNRSGYTLRETQPAGYLDGNDTIGTPGGSARNDAFRRIVLQDGVAGSDNNFGELLPSSISGRKVQDLTGNGLTADDTPQGGVTIKLFRDANGNGRLNVGDGPAVAKTKTAAGTGDYAFTNLPPGRYFVQEVVPNRHIQTGPVSGYHTVLIGPGGVAPGTSVTGKDFANYHQADNKDLVRNIRYVVNGTTPIRRLRGNTESGDQVQVTFTVPARASVQVSFVTYLAPGPTFDPHTAGQQVVYDVDSGTFGPGRHTLLVHIPDCYYQIDLVAGPVIEPFGPAGSNIFYSAQRRLIDADNGGNGTCDADPASLSGFVYEDLNNDGVKQAAEGGIGGVTVTLTGTDDQGNPVNRTQTTQADGSYRFDDLRPSDAAGYTIAEAQPTGYFDGQDTIGTPGGTAGNDVFSNIVLAAGVAGVNNNFGELPPASLAGRVFSDRDNDGVFDNLTELGIGAATLTLTGTDDLNQPVSQTTSTAADGTYAFTDLRPGTYTLTEAQPAGTFDGKDTVGTQGGTASHNPVTQDDVFSGVQLQAGTHGINNNFGELLPGSLAGFVYADVNNDGVKQASEAGISGVTLTLTGTDDRGDSVDMTAATDSNGAYAFVLLRPGTYMIAESQPAGYLDGRDAIGTQGGTAGDDVLSAIVLNAGVLGVNNNFGELPPGSLAGFVYLDANDDGVKQASETGIADITVVLTGTDDRGNVLHQTTTSSSGAYSFGNLRPGTYSIQENQPAGYLDGQDTIGTPGGTTGNDLFSNIVLNTGVQGTDNNFGELLDIGPGTAVLSGFVYVDYNNNGIFEPAEPTLPEDRIPDTTVTLTGTDDLGQPVLRTATTDFNGYYEFAGLRAGTYTLTETQPTNYIEEVMPDGLDARNGMVIPGSAGGPDTIDGILLAAGQTLTDNNFGELLPASLAGFVYLDNNDDGFFDGSEAGIEGVIVTLTGVDDLGTVLTLSTTTNSDGAYRFDTLRPGTYTLTETQPATHQDGQDTLGTVFGVPRGVHSGNDVFSQITLSVGEPGEEYNFGERLPTGNAQLSGYVYQDLNNDGLKQAGEEGISGVTVALTGTNVDGAAVNLTVSSDSSGLYLFPNLRPSDAAGYTLTETQPAGYLDGEDTIGTPGGTAGNDVFSAIVLNAGVNGANNDFGELPPNSLSGYVYLDDDNDGVRENGESGIFVGVGVLITLDGTDDRGNAVHLVTTADTSGFYSFGNLRPGTYQIQESQPIGYGDGKDTPGDLGGTASSFVDGNGKLHTEADLLYGIMLNGAGLDGREYDFGELDHIS